MRTQYILFLFVLLLAMISRRRAKWQKINKRVKKHLVTLEIQCTEIGNIFQKEREIRMDNENVKEPIYIKPKCPFDSDSKHSQECNDYNIFNDISIVEDIFLIVQAMHLMTNLVLQ